MQSHHAPLPQTRLTTPRTHSPKFLHFITYNVSQTSSPAACHASKHSQCITLTHLITHSASVNHIITHTRSAHSISVTHLLIQCASPHSLSHYACTHLTTNSHIQYPSPTSAPNMHHPCGHHPIVSSPTTSIQILDSAASPQLHQPPHQQEPHKHRQTQPARQRKNRPVHPATSYSNSPTTQCILSQQLLDAATR